MLIKVLLCSAKLLLVLCPVLCLLLALAATASSTSATATSAASTAASAAATAITASVTTVAGGPECLHIPHQVIKALQGSAWHSGCSPGSSTCCSPAGSTNSGTWGTSSGRRAEHNHPCLCLLLLVPR